MRALKRFFRPVMIVSSAIVTTQAHEGIETDQMLISPRLPCEHPVPVPGKKQCQGKVHLIKYVQNVNMHEKLLLSEYSDKYLQKQALETA